MFDRRPYNPGPYDDDWEDQPSQGEFYKWILGICVPIVIATYGVFAIITQNAEFTARNITLPLHGLNAQAFGVASLCAAIFLHCHYFWGNIYNQAWFAVLGKILSACGFVAGLAFLLIRVGILGIK